MLPTQVLSHKMSVLYFNFILCELTKPGSSTAHYPTFVSIRFFSLQQNASACCFCLIIDIFLKKKKEGGGKPSSVLQLFPMSWEIGI